MFKSIPDEDLNTQKSIIASYVKIYNQQKHPRKSGGSKRRKSRKTKRKRRKTQRKSVSKKSKRKTQKVKKTRKRSKAKCRKRSRKNLNGGMIRLQPRAMDPTKENRTDDQPPRPAVFGRSLDLESALRPAPPASAVFGRSLDRPFDNVEFDEQANKYKEEYGDLPPIFADPPPHPITTVEELDQHLGQPSIISLE